MSISEAFELYRRDVILFSNQSHKTEENHLVCLRALLVFFDDVSIESLSFQMIRDWKEALEKTRSANTVRNYIIKLRVVLIYCEKCGLPVVNPSLIAIPKRGDTIPDFVTKEDVAQLIKVVSKPCGGYARLNRLRNAAIISTLYASGVRVSELCGLNRSDIRDDGTFTVIGKGRKARLCFLDARSTWLIDEYCAERQDNNIALFMSIQNGRRMTAGNIQEVFRLARKKAGFTMPVHAHTLRHSYATNLMRNGMHIYTVSRLMGHASIATTQVYLHITDNNLKADYNKYHSI